MAASAVPVLKFVKHWSFGIHWRRPADQLVASWKRLEDRFSEEVGVNFFPGTFVAKGARSPVSTFLSRPLLAEMRGVLIGTRPGIAVFRVTAFRGAALTLMKETILIVDDERSIRESLAKALRSAGYDTLLAADGNEAVVAYSEHRPDLVLLDLNMPARNGWTTFEEITSQQPLTPIIIITGRPGQFELAAAARVGALMEKPLDVTVLLETVRALIDEPVSKRLSRLTYCTPGTIYCGSESGGDRLPDKIEISELRRLRKRQLDDLRSCRGS